MGNRMRVGGLAVAVAVAVGLTAGCSGSSAPSSAPTSVSPVPGASSPAGSSGSTRPSGSSPSGSSPANPSSVGAVARAAVETDGVTVHRVVVESDVAVVHVQAPATAASPSGLARIDVVRVGPDGTVVERSTVRQSDGGRTPSGHTMFDGGGDPSAPVDDATRAANEAVVARLYDEVFNGKQTAVVDELVAADEIQHNPAIADGSAALKALTANGLPVTVRRLTSQGDLVAAEVTYGSVAAVDIFRLRDGRIVEHWDVLDLARPA